MKENQVTLEGFRLSPQQARLWLLQQGSRSQPYYALCAVLLEGSLKIKALETALTAVVKRHEILRTTFRSLPAMRLPLQVISEQCEIALRDHDLNGWEPEAQAGLIEALLPRMSFQPFDFEQGPLLETSLLELSPQKHLLLLKLPALCSDRLGLENLVRELSLCYAAALDRGKAPNEVMQYADLAQWQNELLESEETETGREYWRRQDLGGSLAIKLPFEKRYPASVTEQSYSNGFTPQFFSITVNSDLAEKLEQLAQQQESAASILLLACWQLLLWRLTGQSDILIGTACDGRKYEELKQSLGLFAKYLPVRAHLEKDQHFGRLVRQLDDSIRELHKWEEYFAWEYLNGWTGQSNELPFFPYCFEYAPEPASFSSGELSFTIADCYACTDRFKIKLTAARWAEALQLAFHFDAQLFAWEDLRSVAEHYLSLLTHAVSQPQARLKELPLLSPAAQARLLKEFSGSVGNYGPARPIHHLFEEQAELKPGAVAVVVEEKQLSYGELNRWANQLAHYLQGLGVGPEVLVGLCLERSVELLVGMIGILKAGGAYLPLDPVLPAGRLAGMMADARPKVVLTQEALLERLAETEAVVVCLDRDGEQIKQCSTENARSGVSEENLVYVLFTSGSTGRPKGVAVEHRQLYNYVCGVSERLKLGAGASYATVTTYAADLGNTAIWPALCSGGCVHLVKAERASDAAALGEYITRHQVDCLKIVPSHLRALLGTSQGEGVLPRRRLVLGGEAASWELVRRVRELGPGCEVFNHYGPTETTVGVLSGEVGEEQRSVPLGWPLGNVRVYVLDEELRPVPVWVEGEIYLGGAQVTRGYLGQPEQTAAVYLPDPYSEVGGGRMYRSGDVGRYLPDGRVEFLGRRDEQVKVRGYRVELGEIEAVLKQHAEVAESVVVVREGVSGERELVGYVVGKVGAEVRSSELMKFLRERLPEYMVPGGLVVLERLPLTANGKVDRQALPEPEGRAGSREYVAPRTQVEEIVAGIWAEVLGIERVGVNDNFFELGGHSLMATQLISRLREACKVELPLRSLFDAPTVAGTAASLEAMMKAGMGVQAPPIERCSRDGELPLSFAQQRLWFLDQWEPASPFYNIFAPVRLKGQLNVPALEQTLTEIRRRHEVLRTTFPALEGRPLQVIAPAQPISLPVEDLSLLPQQQREIAARQIAAEEASRPFDLANGPLVRARLLKLDADEHVALLTMHHIVSDGWSTGILIREIAALYEAFSAGRPSPLPELPIQYADFAVWQRKWLQGEVLEAQLAYWRRKLGGTLPVLELPTDRPRPAVQSFRGAHQAVELGAASSEAVKTLSQREGVTLFMTLLAAFKALLYRYSGQDDIIIGSPIANRNRVEIEALVGFFVNTLVLRTDLSGNPRFRELIDRVREVALEASAHQDLPFEKLVDELQPERDLSRTPLFQVVFVMQSTPGQTLELPGLTLTPLEVEGETTKFDLILAIRETASGLIGQVSYNTDLFDDSTISRMLGHYRTLLAAAVARPELRLSDLPLLTEAERHQLLTWNAGQAVYSVEACLHQLFEAQVERTPNNIAVVCEGECLTYAQLNERANKLAHHLRRLGVGPDVLVGLCMERSLNLVVAILGILKAGGAYLPLDLAYPKERLAFMLADSQAPVLLTEQLLLDRLPQHQAQVICLDADWERIAQESAANLSNETRVENLAYVIYTSGSTGRPKGVLVNHANVVRLFAATQDWYQFDETDVWTLFHSYAFDFSVWELWGALLYGGRLVVVPYLMSRSPEAFYELLSKEQVTVLNQTPSAFRQLIQAEETAAGASSYAGELALRLVIFGGEALELQSLQPWFERHGDQRPQLVNMYGITETTVHVSYWPIWAADLKEGKGSVIGGAIPDLRILVLDAHLNLAPIGVAGEMYVGGAGVARGYLDRPELTAERFIPDPYSQEPGARLYKTGDLARYLADGDLEYLGRIDHQVKIRGFRIELGEIEAVLAQHPAIREAVVLAQDSTGSDRLQQKRLVAYLVAKQGEAPSVSELRDFLKVKLPEYMVPAAFVMLDALPLTENGKLDRRALPAPDTARPELGRDYIAPRNETEAMLAQVWASVLGLERVGIHDNFFELGGDSILSIQIIARANQAGLRLTPKQIFQYQTIAELAAVAASTPAIEAEQGLVTGALPLVPIQHWFFEQELPDPHHWNQAILLEVKQALEPALLERAVEQLLIHHDALRLRFTQEESGWRQTIIAPDGRVPFSLIDLSKLPEAEQKLAIETRSAELQASLNLAEGPLLRVALFDLGPGKSARLLIIIHHLAVDGVSWRILLEDLQTCYQQLSRGEQMRLPPKTTSFKRWAERLVEYAQVSTVKEEQSYWLDAARTRTPQLPVDYPGGVNTEASAQSVVVSLSVEETTALLQEVPEAYRTQINDVLLAALAQAFSEWTGERHLLIHLEGHGREDIFDDVDLSRTVGWFTTIYPVLLEVPRKPATSQGSRRAGEQRSRGTEGNPLIPRFDPGELLKSVKEQLRRIPNRGIGYGLLRYLSQDPEVSEKLRTLPRAEVSFNYLGQLDQVLPAGSPFAPARSSSGPVHSPRGSRYHLLEISGRSFGGCLQLSWRYSENLHRRSTIERLAESFLEALRAIIVHCQSPEVGGYTPSDFSLAQLDQHELERVFDEVEFEGR